MTRWVADELSRNAAHLEQTKAARLDALADVDALGHRVLLGLGTLPAVTRDEELVAMALLRRSVTLFAGLRLLLSNAQAESAKLQLRALFEVLLFIRYLTFGAKWPLSSSSVSSPKQREVRAKYYLAAAIRNEIYQRLALLRHRYGRIDIGRKVRQDMKQEIDERLNLLTREYATQHRRIGPVGSKPNVHYDRMEWYSFGFKAGTVNSIWALAKRLNWAMSYGMIYGPLSGLVHPHGIQRDVSVQEGAADVLSPYLVDAFDVVAGWGSRFHLLGLKCIASAYDPRVLADVKQVEKAAEQVIRPSASGAPLAWF